MEREWSLVTGAAGFIGSKLTQRLLEQGQNVVAIDCFLPNLYPNEVKYKRWSQLENVSGGRLHKIPFDLRNGDFSILKSFEFTAFYNEAAMPGLNSNWADFTPYYECNLQGLHRLLEFARLNPLQTFVQASTSSVYGKTAIGDELQTLNPTSPYGVSKLAAEKLLLAYFEWYNTPVKILRYFSVYGPNQRPDMAYAKIFKAIRDGHEFTIYGDGEQKRSNTFVDDVVEATILSHSKATAGDVFNVCGDETISLNEAISLIEEISGKKLKRNYLDGRVGDQRDTSGDNSFLKEKLDWRAKIGIFEGLTKQYEAAL